MEVYNIRESYIIVPPATITKLKQYLMDIKTQHMNMHFLDKCLNEKKEKNSKNEKEIIITRVSAKTRKQDLI